MIANQALIDEIVSNVLAKLRPVAARHMSPAANSTPLPVAPVSKDVQYQESSKVHSLETVDLNASVITAETLETSVRPGQELRISRHSILTPSARDWLHAKRTKWTRLEKNAERSSSATGARFQWQIILQTMTPTVRALQEGLRRLADGWKIEVVGQPFEAAALATNLVNTAECDGVVVFSEYAEVISCKANRSERVRAAVIQNGKQWEQVMRTLSANVVCISPVGKTLVELRNLLRDCAGSKPRAPAGW